MRMHEKNDMKVSVLFAIDRYSEDLRSSFESVMRQRYPHFEILVVDASKNDEVRVMIEDLHDATSKIKYYQADFHSRSALLNRGVMEADSDFILLTGNACGIPDDWISNMVEPLILGEDIVQGGIRYSREGFWARKMEDSNEKLMSTLSDGENIDLIDSRNLAMKRSALLDVGMFNKHVKDLEDLEVLFRLKQYQYNVRFLRSERVVCHECKTLREVIKRKIRRGTWLLFIKDIHGKGIANENEVLFGPLGFSNFILFFPRLLPLFLRNGISEFIFEVVTGTALRFGIIMGLIGKGNFHRSKWAKYY